MDTSCVVPRLAITAIIHAHSGAVTHTHQDRQASNDGTCGLSAAAVEPRSFVRLSLEWGVAPAPPGLAALDVQQEFGDSAPVGFDEADCLAYLLVDGFPGRDAVVEVVQA